MGKEYAKQIHDADIPLETWLIDYRIQVLQELLHSGSQTGTEFTGYVVQDE